MCTALRREIQPQGFTRPLAWISSSWEAAAGGGVLGAQGLGPVVAHSALARILEKGQLNCADASMEMLLKHCHS